MGGAHWHHLANTFEQLCAAAMRLYIKLLSPLVSVGKPSVRSSRQLHLTGRADDVLKNSSIGGRRRRENNLAFVWTTQRSAGVCRMDCATVCTLPLMCLERVLYHRRNRPMGPVGRVPSNFGDHGDQVYLVPQLAVIFRRALWEVCSVSTDLLAEFKGKRKKRRGGNGRDMGGEITGDG